ncbi:hypothetical protein FOA52_002539 [Chlamydomonas sp. UWO 241]|nr:hypothetical protein FOA52_002539 [Chlamydomonas sp. UWO 241]
MTAPKGDVLLLEVGPDGFRLLRHTKEPFCMFPWGQIHSWAHGASVFTFRFFDDGKHAIVQHALSTKDVDTLLACIQKIIEAILAERRKSAISDEAFEALLSDVKASSDSTRQLDKLRQAVQAYTFTSDQGRKLLQQLPTAFDVVEAATVLHPRLIDQNRFSNMLEVLDCQTDRDNVWHRITTAKRGTKLNG